MNESLGMIQSDDLQIRSEYSNCILRCVLTRSPLCCRLYERKKKMVERLQEQLTKLEVQATDKVMITFMCCCGLVIMSVNPHAESFADIFPRQNNNCSHYSFDMFSMVKTEMFCLFHANT